MPIIDLKWITAPSSAVQNSVLKNPIQVLEGESNTRAMRVIDTGQEKQIALSFTRIPFFAISRPHFNFELYVRGQEPYNYVNDIFARNDHYLRFVAE